MYIYILTWICLCRCGSNWDSRYQNISIFCASAPPAAAFSSPTLESCLPIEAVSSCWASSVWVGCCLLWWAVIFYALLAVSNHPGGRSCLFYQACARNNFLCRLVFFRILCCSYSLFIFITSVFPPFVRLRPVCSPAHWARICSPSDLWALPDSFSSWSRDLLGACCATTTRWYA